MNSKIEVTKFDVLKAELEVELSKTTQPQLPLYKHGDFESLLEELPKYHDGPRNSPDHLYAALADSNLVWYRTEIPASNIIIGPGEPGLHTEISAQAGGFIAQFVQIVKEHYSKHDCFKSYFWDAEIRYPTVPCVLVEYNNATPWLPEPKKDYGQVYRLQDGYHRVFQMILRGMTTISSFMACYKDGSPWKGNYSHIRFEDGRWVSRGK